MNLDRNNVFIYSISLFLLFGGIGLGYNGFKNAYESSRLEEELFGEFGLADQDSSLSFTFNEMVDVYVRMDSKYKDFNFDPEGPFPKATIEELRTAVQSYKEN